MSAPEKPDCAAFFSPGGPLDRGMSGYRERPQQTQMAVAIESALSRREHVVVEAGTGVGKSLGYLVPALLNGCATNRRVVVSTHTISLQQQLLAKDLPLLAELLPVEFRAEVAKGRNNYLAPRRLRLALDAARDRLDFREDLVELERVAAAWHASLDGTRQEIEPSPDALLWDQVQSENDNCLGKSCPHFDDDCSYHVARRRLVDADLLVVNHSLYLADLALRRVGAQVLPDHDIVIFDEAHMLETVALDHFGWRVTRSGCRRLLFRLCGGRQPGLLPQIPGSERARSATKEAIAAIDAFFARVEAYCEGPARQRVLADRRALIDDVTPRLEDLTAALADLKRQVAVRERTVEISAYVQRIENMIDTMARLLDPVPEERVHWAETGTMQGAVSLVARPLQVADILRETLFDRVDTVVLTSATLSVGRKDGFDWISRSLGLDGATTLTVGSPFDYRQAVRLRVPTWLDQPGPEASNDGDERIAAAVLHYVERSQGGAFVLFTSYRQLRRVRDLVAARLAALQFPLLIHGDGVDRSRLVEVFRQSQNSVLFGTDSFWQGVDVQGETLRLVIIVRLPFPVPDDPLQRARADRLRASGGNPFRDLALPEAIIKFKQGFGRLIRTESDRGTVVVLDTRLVEKHYGRAFLDAIPAVDLVLD